MDIGSDPTSAAWALGLQIVLAVIMIALMIRPPGPKPW